MKQRRCLKAFFLPLSNTVRFIPSHGRIQVIEAPVKTYLQRC